MELEYKKQLVQLAGLCAMAAEYDLYAEDMFNEEEIAKLAKLATIGEQIDYDESRNIAIEMIKDILTNV